MSERAMSKVLVNALKRRGLDPIRVENPARPGTPDVNWTEGWIENKWLRRWPPVAETVKLPKYTAQQRVWHARRAAAGGNVKVLLKVGASEWVLFEGEDAAKELGRVSRTRLYDIAIGRWTDGLNIGELVKCLHSQRHKGR